jgi:hypothetical protein
MQAHHHQKLKKLSGGQLSTQRANFKLFLNSEESASFYFERIVN